MYSVIHSGKYGKIIDITLYTRVHETGTICLDSIMPISENKSKVCHSLFTVPSYTGNLSVNLVSPWQGGIK